MSVLRKKSESIRRFILEHLESNSKGIMTLTSNTFKISRQAVNKHMRQLIDQNAVIREGKGRGRGVRYSLHPQESWNETLTILEHPEEHVVWSNEVKQKIGQLPDNALAIWIYGFTEMYNNVIDHSGGTMVTIKITKTADSTKMSIMDNGIGIFTKIKNAMGLSDERHAVIELTKGKLTTDPANHSGQGIFFSSRMFDEFSILSGEVFLSHVYKDDEDWILQNSEYQLGTFISMKLQNNTARTSKQIFDNFTDDDYGFTKTVVPVRLAQYGNEQLVSRSQAKRLLTRVERFKTVLLDFKDVESIGQAFSDEVFRVFVNQHPTMKILPINANDAVMQMISRVESSVEIATTPSGSQTASETTTTIK